VAPHPDDETLGCGGTIIKMREAGVPVTIVFMTNGERSHQRFVSPAEMGSRRAAEAVAACHKLGVDERDVLFLGLRQGALTADRQVTVDHLLSETVSRRIRQFYVPHRWDGHPDHRATFLIARTVAGSLGRKGPAVWEYPVWFWHRSHLESASRPWFLRRAAALLRSGVVNLSGAWRSVFVGDVIDRKRAALQEHQTQMTRLDDNPHWLTLADVADGAFLRSLLSDYELFYRCFFH
jgi:LmbE family N-acetylglucosaminyl deacetylase